MNHFNQTHGHAPRGAKTATYKAWEAMHRRCRLESQDSYPQYGGRGIAVCEQWASFEEFLADMGEKPVGMSLERKDSNGPYAPNNCRWATQKEQQRNRRGNRLLSHDGVTMTVAEWAERIGVGSATIRSRIDKHGWSVARALETPARTRAECMRQAQSARWKLARIAL